MQDKNTTESTFFQLLGPILSQDLWRKISETVESVDKYVKKLKTVQLVQLVMNAEMRQYKSLAEISNSLNKDAFAEAIHLESISTSQISRRFRDMSPEVTDIIHKSVVQTLGLKLGYNALRQSLGRLYLIDASTITLCLTQYLWADFRKTKGSVKLHQRIRFDGDPIPDAATITVARKSDKSQLEFLIRFILYIDNNTKHRHYDVEVVICKSNSPNQLHLIADVFQKGTLGTVLEADKNYIPLFFNDNSLSKGFMLNY